jgi:hypothetical protein
MFTLFHTNFCAVLYKNFGKESRVLSIIFNRDGLPVAWFPRREACQSAFAGRESAREDVADRCKMSRHGTLR